MIERTLSMAFKDVTGKKCSISIKDIKEDVEDAKVTEIMDAIVTNKLVKTEAGELVEKVAAQIVNREVTKVTI